ncbi:MAG: [FeFe] hydrogenase H-cluster radical SAM maturase HydG [Treponema sp.]|nr:[FeFe] hydrogenase H-cluster radical SAM maturase HydG [Treponema sp.]
MDTCEERCCSGEKRESIAGWVKAQIKEDEINRYMENGHDFIDDSYIRRTLEENRSLEKERLRGILNKAHEIRLMDDADVAALCNITDPDLRAEVFQAAEEIKKQVYDNRIVMFAPLYLSSKCVNACRYCGFRADNTAQERTVLTQKEVEEETHVLASKIGHKRLVIVFGEHPESASDYIVDCMKTIYSVHDKVRNGIGEIRRVNVNAAPMSIADLKKLEKGGIGTFQVFQETYDHEIYKSMHPAQTLKGNYGWRLYALHRAMDAGIDDVAIGCLFGLSDWKFDVLGMVAHARDMERRFGLGPHTLSVPRLEKAIGTDFSFIKNWVSDEDFRYLVAVLRVAIPYAGLIVTNRERPETIRSLSNIITQRDADSRIGLRAYSEAFKAGLNTSADKQKLEKEQFELADTRSLDEVIREAASLGHIVSFCTAGYRCGRTGKKIMDLLRTGQEGCFCKLNAVLTFQEWLDDFGSEETRKIGTDLIKKEIEEIHSRTPSVYTQVLYDKFMADYKKVVAGQRDLYF